MVSFFFFFLFFFLESISLPPLFNKAPFLQVLHTYLYHSLCVQYLSICGWTLFLTFLVKFTTKHLQALSQKPSPSYLHCISTLPKYRYLFCPDWSLYHILWWSSSILILSFFLLFIPSDLHSFPTITSSTVFFSYFFFHLIASHARPIYFLPHLV